MESREVVIALVAAACFGIGTVFGPVALKSMPYFLWIAGVSLVAALLLIVSSLLMKERLQFEKIMEEKRNWLEVFISRYFLGTLVIAAGFSLTSATNALVLFRTEPAFVVLISCLIFKEKAKARELALVAMAIAGSVLFVLAGSGDFTSVSIGDLLIIVSMVFMAYSYFPSKRILRKMNSVTLNFSGSAAMGALALPLVFVFGESVSVSQENMANVFLYSLLVLVLGGVLFYISLKKLRAWVLSTILTLNTLIGGVFAYLWLGESLNALQLVGAGVLIVSVFFVSVES